MSGGADDVAVVIAAKDAAATIDAALASVAAQTIGVARVVLVDDGSSDGTAERARRWEHLIPLEVLRLQHSLGPGVARNRALDIVTEPLVALLDADDIWLPNHLEVLLALGPGRGRAACALAVNWVPEVGLRIRDRRTWPQAPQQMAALLIDNFVPICTLIAAHDIRAAGGFRRGVTEDWDLWIRMARQGVTFHPARVPTVLYRRSLSSRSAYGREVHENIETLRLAAEESRDLDEQRRARVGLRRQQARLALQTSYSRALDGERKVARAEAWQALRWGSQGVRLRAAAMVACPAVVAAARARRRARPAAMLHE